MRHLNGVYTQTFNRRHQQVGHVFQGRFKAILVERDAYLLELSRYVVLNPVRANMVQVAQDWPWSSYRVTAGLSENTRLVSTDCLLAQFGHDSIEAQREYRRFVAQGCGSSPWKQLKGQIYLGSESFVANLPKRDATLREIPKMQRFADRPTMSDIFSAGASAEAIHRAYRDYGYTQRAIAQHMGVHYATISRRIRKWEETVRDCEEC
jgi:putative transposase